MIQKTVLIGLFLIVFSQSANALEDKTIDVSRNNNYTESLTTEWVFQSYNVTSTSDQIYITTSKNTSTIIINFIISPTIDISKVHGINVKTYDVNYNIIEQCVLFIYVLNLTDTEIKGLLTELEIVTEIIDNSSDDYNDLWDKYNHLLNQTEKKTFMEEDGDNFMVAIVAVMYTISCMGVFFVIPYGVGFWRKLKQQKQKYTDLETIKKDSEKNLRQSEYNMNPKVKASNGKQEMWVDLQPPHQLKTLETMDPRVNFAFYMNPPKDMEYDSKKTSTLDVVKFLLENNDIFKADAYERKVFLDAFCDYLGQVGENEKNQIYLKNCTFEDFDDFRATTGLAKEKEWSGDPTKKIDAVTNTRNLMEKEYEEIIREKKQQKSTYEDSTKTANLFK